MPATYGFIGSGTTPKKNAVALIDDLIGGDHDAKFIIPVSQSTWTDTMAAIADYAIDNGHPIEVVTDETADSNKDFVAIIQAAEKTHRVTKVPMKVVNLLEKVTTPALVVAWDDEDADSLKALERALSKGVPASDLTNGLEPLEFEDDEEDDDQADVDTIFDGIVNNEADPDDTPMALAEDDEDEDPQAILDTIGGNASETVEDDEPEFVEDEDGFASPIDPETDEFESDESVADTDEPEVSSHFEPESFDNDSAEAETTNTNESFDSDDDASSEDDDMTTATQAREIAHPFTPSPAADPADFMGTYSLDLDTDELVVQAMNVLCDRISAQVLALMMPRLDSIERFLASQGHVAPATPTVTRDKAKAKAAVTPTKAKSGKVEAPAAKTKTAPKAKAAPAAKTSGDLDINAVRTWARENGYEVGDRGRIKQEIKDAYMAAQK